MRLFWRDRDGQDRSGQISRNHGTFGSRSVAVVIGEASQSQQLPRRSHHVRTRPRLQTGQNAGQRHPLRPDRPQRRGFCLTPEEPHPRKLTGRFEPILQTERRCRPRRAAALSRRCSGPLHLPSGAEDRTSGDAAAYTNARAVSSCVIGQWQSFSFASSTRGSRRHDAVAASAKEQQQPWHAGGQPSRSDSVSSLCASGRRSDDHLHRQRPR